MVNKIREFFQLLKENRIGGCLLNLSVVVMAMIAILIVIVMYKGEEEELPKADDTLVNIETEDEVSEVGNPQPIDISRQLVYDANTKIIYIDCHTNYIDCLIEGNCVYFPYYSENGKMCRYINGEIVEVEDDE